MKYPTEMKALGHDALAFLSFKQKLEILLPK